MLLARPGWLPERQARPTASQPPCPLPPAPLARPRATGHGYFFFPSTSTDVRDVSRSLKVGPKQKEMAVCSWLSSPLIKCPPYKEPDSSDRDKLCKEWGKLPDLGLQVGLRPPAASRFQRFPPPHAHPITTWVSSSTVLPTPAGASLVQSLLYVPDSPVLGGQNPCSSKEQAVWEGRSESGCGDPHTSRAGGSCRHL